jgi:hypothetical protein
LSAGKKFAKKRRTRELLVRFKACTEVLGILFLYQILHTSSCGGKHHDDHNDAKKEKDEYNDAKKEKKDEASHHDDDDDDDDKHWSVRKGGNISDRG